MTGSGPHDRVTYSAILRTKSVWSPIDVWMPSLAPSERLLRSAQAGRITWARFLREYRRELFMDGPVDARSRSIKNHGQKFTLRLIRQLARRNRVTLMCHCAEDQAQCHRHELRRVIRGAGV